MNDRPRILVTGSNGQLGREIRDLESKCPQFQFFFTTRAELDITNKKQVDDFFKESRPDYCINAAAYTAVDKAESGTEKPEVFKVNVEAVENLAQACFQYHCKLVQVSTDYVFDGSSSQPYMEEMGTSPINTYGISKLEGERVARETTDAIIVRTSWVYSSYGNNFVKTMMRLLSTKEEIGVVNDQFGSPTYAADLAMAILYMINFKWWQPGIYHYSNDGVISWFDFAEQIKEFLGSSCKIVPLSTSEYPTAAKRPAYSVLDKSKIYQVFGIRPRFWVDSLAECMEKLLTNNS